MEVVENTYFYQNRKYGTLQIPTLTNLQNSQRQLFLYSLEMNLLLLYGLIS